MNLKTKQDNNDDYDFKTKVDLFFKQIAGYVRAALIDFKRSPMNLFFSIAYPVILILLFGAIFSEESGTFNGYDLYVQSGGDTGVEVAPGVNLNYTNIVLEVFEELETNESEPIFHLHYIPLENEQNEIIDPGAYLEKVEGYICLVLPQDFTQLAINYPPPTNVTVIMDKNSQSAQAAYNIVSNVINNLNLGMAGYNDTSIGINPQDIYLEEEIEYLDFLIPGIIGVTIMNNAVIGTINRHTFFKNQGIFRKLATTPIKKGQVVLGETIWQFVQGVLSIVAVLLFGWLVFKLPFGNALWIIQILDWKMIIISISAVISFTGLGMIGASLVKNTDAATAAGNFLTFPMMFLSGAFFDVSNIAGLNIVSKFLPLTYMIDAYRAAMVTNNTLVAWTNTGYSFAFGLVLLTIGILLIKMKEE